MNYYINILAILGCFTNKYSVSGIMKENRTQLSKQLFTVQSIIRTAIFM